MPERLLATLAGNPARPPLSLKPVALAIAAAWVGLLSLVAGSAALFLARDYRSELGRTETELASIARAIDVNLGQSLGQIETVLEIIADGSAKNAPMNPLTRSWLQRTPQVINLSVTVASGSPEPMFGLPRRADVSREWAIPLSLPVLDASGRIASRVVAQLRADYFNQLFRDVRLDPRDTISVTDSRGILLMRYPVSEAHLGRPYLDPGTRSRPHAQETYIVRTGPDAEGRRAIVAIRPLAVYPLVVTVSRPMAAALARHQGTVDRVIWGVVVFGGLIGLLAWLVFEDVRRRETARQALHEVAAALEQRVQQRTLDLETSNRELLAFSYSVSHDLRAPLRAINGFSRALQEDCADRLDETGRDYLDRIVRASVRMGELIDALLKLAQVARQPLELKELDISAIAGELVEDLRRAWPGRKVGVRIEPGMRASADEALLRNVLGNLLDNAWKFTREREAAQIEVGHGGENDRDLFWVRDNGIGFEMAFADKLFQPFQQLHTAQGYAGTGIGLASARRIVERHGGRMWVESAPGQGTTVLFTLPRSAVVRHAR